MQVSIEFFPLSNLKLPRDFYEGSLQILANELHLRLKLQWSNETFMTYWKLLAYLWLRSLQTFFEIEHISSFENISKTIFCLQTFESL